ncbi:MAG: hypothetical protein HS111_09985 [Kofleriaceae bacterium]|nr:hypothetical protein [Kofleriaceae bacterium]
MVQVNMDEARRVLVEGRAVEIAGRLVRFYPSYREVAEMMGKHPSSVARWAKREDLLRARGDILAADRAASAAQVPRTTMTEVEAVLRVVAARWAARRRPPAARDIASVLRIVACLLGVADRHPRLLRDLERLQRKFAASTGSRR